ncbi:MAG TPA: maleylpyruvate isomerase family mycothiol-dependent enzyme [Acidimicrobiales bacterium]|nr:maleylpyruvate isomerase family mycothiol-dependent enzyme [Acidimicrobiales bacterium]
MKTEMKKDTGDAAQALAAQHAELADLLESLEASDWDLPTRCPGWKVSDVVLHLAQTDEMAVASLEGRVAGFIAERVAGEEAASVDDGAGLMVARERGAAPDEVFARWSSAARTLDGMLDTADGHARVMWVVGELSVRTLTTTRLAETWIHSGDVAEAVGAELKTDDRLRHIARLAWRTLPYAFAREGRHLSGPVAFELTGPGGEAWSFAPDQAPVTVVRGDGVELCLVAARRVEPSSTSLIAYGADGGAVLSLVRTYA